MTLVFLKGVADVNLPSRFYFNTESQPPVFLWEYFKGYDYYCHQELGGGEREGRKMPCVAILSISLVYSIYLVSLFTCLFLFVSLLLLLLLLLLMFAFFLLN